MSDPLAEAKKVAEAEGDEVKVALLDAVQAAKRLERCDNLATDAASQQAVVLVPATFVKAILDGAERVEALLSSKGATWIEAS